MTLMATSLLRLCIYSPARGTVNIEEQSEGIHSNNKLLVPSDFGIVNWMGNTGSDYPWRNIDGTRY